MSGVSVEFSEDFDRTLEKVSDKATRLRVQKQILKIIGNPLVGKPMRHDRKGTREVRIGSFRLSYVFLEKENALVFLDIYHKDGQ